MSPLAARSESPIVVTRAAPDDLPAVLALLQQAGLPLDGLAERFGTAWVARRAGRVVGAVALEWHGRGPGATVALLRSLVVDPALRGVSVGQRLARAALGEAERRGVSGVYLLTTTAAGFFPRLGFRVIGREALPPALEASEELRGACPASAVAMVLERP